MLSSLKTALIVVVLVLVGACDPEEAREAAFLDTLEVNPQYALLESQGQGEQGLTRTYDLGDAPAPRAMDDALERPAGAEFSSPYEGGEEYERTHTHLGYLAWDFDGKRCSVAVYVMEYGNPREFGYETDRQEVLHLHANCRGV